MLRFIIICCCIAFYSNALVEVVEVSTIKSLDNYITDNSLVIFDIDDTLIASSIELGSSPWFYKEIKRYKDLGLSYKEAMAIVYPQFMSSNKIENYHLTDHHIHDILSSLRSRDILHFGLTARRPIINNITHNMLSDFKIDLDYLKLDSFKFVGHKEDAIYDKGIIFAQGNDKGRVLVDFLVRNQELFKNVKKIIFVDDLKKNVALVCRAITSYNKDLNFTGLRYNKYDNFVRKK